MTQNWLRLEPRVSLSSSLRLFKKRSDLTMMAKALGFALSVAAFSCAMSQDMVDMDKVLAADAECATGEECALNALQQKAVVAQLQAEDSVEKFAAALEEGEEELAAEVQSSSRSAQTASDTEKWGPSPPPPPAFNPYYHQYGNPYGQMHPGLNPYGGHPYGVPGPVCLNKIEGSSCMVFSCAKSRGPTTCNTQDYFCYCQPGFCSDGKGCVPQAHLYR